MNVLDGTSICLVGINYSPEKTGIAPYTTAMAEALAAAGASVHVVTGVPHYPEWSVDDLRYRYGRYWQEELNRVRITRCAHYVPTEPDLIGRVRMESSFLRRALPVIRRDKSDAVIAVTPSLAGLAAAVLGRRDRRLGAVVQDLTGNAAGESGASGQRAASSIARAEYAMLTRCSQVGVITPRFGDLLRAQGIDAGRLVQLPNFAHIEPADVQRSEARARLGWPTDAFTVVHTGNMGRKQGLDTSIATAAEAYLRGFEMNLVLVGDGNQRRQLEELAAGLPNVTFVRPLDAKRYPLALAAADVLLLSERPGVKDMSMPSKLTSYTAAGRPIVASIDVEGITFEQLDQFAAAAVTPAGNPEALLDGIRRIRNSPRLASDLVGGAFDMHDTCYRPEGAYQRYVEFARTLVHGHSRALTLVPSIPQQRTAQTPRLTPLRPAFNESTG